MTIGLWTGVFVVAISAAGGIALIFSRALELWRTFKAFGRATEETVAGVVVCLDRLEAKSATLGSDLPRLEATFARLQADLAQLAVLRQAVQDARDSFGWILAVYPRK